MKYDRRQLDHAEALSMTWQYHLHTIVQAITTTAVVGSFLSSVTSRLSIILTLCDEIVFR